MGHMAPAQKHKEVSLNTNLFMKCQIKKILINNMFLINN